MSNPVDKHPKSSYHVTLLQDCPSMKIDIRTNTKGFNAVKQILIGSRQDSLRAWLSDGLAGPSDADSQRNGRAAAPSGNAP